MQYLRFLFPFLVGAIFIAASGGAQAATGPSCQAALDFVKNQVGAGVAVETYNRDEILWMLKYQNGVSGCTAVPSDLIKRMSGDTPLPSNHQRMNCHIAFDYVMNEVERNDLSQVSNAETDWAQQYMTDVEGGTLCSAPPRSLQLRATGHMISNPTTKQAIAVAMDDGDANAALEIGIAYFFGTLVAKDAQKGWDYLHAASKLGSPEADATIADLYKEGKIIDGKPTDGFPYALKAAEAGLPQAMLFVADAYDTGWGVSKNKAQAFKWYEKAASKGMFFVTPVVAERLFTGEGTKKDSAAAYRIVRAAANAGDTNSMALFASMMLREKDYRAKEGEVYYWLNKARAAGNNAVILMDEKYGSQLEDLFKPVPVRPAVTVCPKVLLCDVYYSNNGREKTKICSEKTDWTRCDYQAGD